MSSVTGSTTRRKARSRSRGVSPLTIAMGCVLLTIGVLPFMNIQQSVRQYVHDHPITSFSQDPTAQVSYLDAPPEDEKKGEENKQTGDSGISGESDWGPPRSGAAMDAEKTEHASSSLPLTSEGIWGASSSTRSNGGSGSHAEKPVRVSPTTSLGVDRSGGNSIEAQERGDGRESLSSSPLPPSSHARGGVEEPRLRPSLSASSFSSFMSSYSMAKRNADYAIDAPSSPAVAAVAAASSASTESSRRSANNNGNGGGGTGGGDAAPLPFFKTSAVPCGGVFLFVAVREDSARARSLYRRTWLNPTKNWNLSGKASGTPKALQEDLPSLAYRFFISDSDSGKTTGRAGSGGGSGERRLSGLFDGIFSPGDSGAGHTGGGQRGEAADAVLVPPAVLFPSGSGAPGAAAAREGVRAWVMAWCVKHSEFKFLLLLDLGFSSPLPPLASPALNSGGSGGGLWASSSSSPPTLPEKWALDYSSSPLSSSSSSSAGGGGDRKGFAMVCIERIADELRFRPPERFLWQTHDCSSGESSSWPKRPAFQLFSSDVVELLVHADQQLKRLGGEGSNLEGKGSGGGDSGSSSPGGDRPAPQKETHWSSNALLQSLSLTVLDDGLRVGDFSQPTTLSVQQRDVLSTSLKEQLSLRFKRGSLNASAHKFEADKLQLWVEAGKKGVAAAAAGPGKKGNKKVSEGAQPVCKSMTMFVGLADEDQVLDLSHSNGNRSKPWQQYRDQIIRLGPVCSQASNVNDVGLFSTTDYPNTGRLLNPFQSPAGSAAAAAAAGAGGAGGGFEDKDRVAGVGREEGKGFVGRGFSSTAKLALAARFLDSEDLFTASQRLGFLQSCALNAECLWGQVTSKVVSRWWHVVDGQRASRCHRAEVVNVNNGAQAATARDSGGSGGKTHSAATMPHGSCAEFKSRSFLPPVLAKGQPGFEGQQRAVLEDSGSGGGAVKSKRKQEEGQKQVNKKYASGAVLASFPGSGNTWSRLLLEYASGHFTGSIYNDITLMPVLPGEGVRTHQVLAWKAHTFPSQYVDNYRPARVVLLVRHPISALWSEFQRRLNTEAGSRGGGGHVALVSGLSTGEKSSFKAWSKCMSCRWLQYITAHLQLAQVIPLKILLFERLSVDTAAAMREVLQFLGLEVNEKRLQCATALADHPLVHRPANNFTVHSAFKLFPEQACVILRTIEQHPQGRLVMRLLGYGNSLKKQASKECAEEAEKFECADMLTEEYRGAQACKFSAAAPSFSSSSSSPAGRASSSGGSAMRATTLSFGQSPESSGTDATKKVAAANARQKYEVSAKRSR